MISLVINAINYKTLLVCRSTKATQNVKKFVNIMLTPILIHVKLLNDIFSAKLF